MACAVTATAFLHALNRVSRWFWLAVPPLLPLSLPGGPGGLRRRTFRNSAPARVLSFAAASAKLLCTVLRTIICVQCQNLNDHRLSNSTP